MDKTNTPTDTPTADTQEKDLERLAMVMADHLMIGKGVEPESVFHVSIMLSALLGLRDTALAVVPCNRSGGRPGVALCIQMPHPQTGQTTLRPIAFLYDHEIDADTAPGYAGAAEKKPLSTGLYL
jgi:hypothetical protein